VTPVTPNVNPSGIGSRAYRETFTFRNSPAAVARFPFPFQQDHYAYSVNIERHAPGPAGSVYEYPFDIDEHYVEECQERDLVLAEDPSRFAALVHMMPAQWDVLELLMTSLSRDYPQFFSLDRNGTQWTWQNRLLKLTKTFAFGDTTTLPCPPMEYITRQMQGDFVVLDQREQNLFADAGMVTGPADWTIAFDAGMSFKQWHAPVPLAHEMGVFDRALKYLLQLRLGQPVRRLNWTMTVHPRLDTSPENFHRWGSERKSLTPENIGSDLNLRVELQALFRLGRSNAILFSIRTYLASLNDIASNPEWRRRLALVLAGLPAELVSYKGLTHYKALAVTWLQQQS
jgi:dimethylamine monooxygenase subunit A